MVDAEPAHLTAQIIVPDVAAVGAHRHDVYIGSFRDEDWFEPLTCNHKVVQVRVWVNIVNVHLEFGPVTRNLLIIDPPFHIQQIVGSVVVFGPQKSGDLDISFGLEFEGTDPVGVKIVLDAVHLLKALPELEVAKPRSRRD